MSLLLTATLSPAAMHVPDGFLAAAVLVPAWLIAVAAIALALHKTQQSLDERQVPLMGILAAFIFAAQMINFPVAGGTSGHLVGAALAAILVGPWSAVLILTTVVGVQALVFQDGGLLALGANLLNMAVIAPLVGYGIYQAVRSIAGSWKRGPAAAGFAGAWAATVTAAVAASLELALSGTAPLPVVLPAMFAVHVLIGAGEGLITVGALAFVATSRRTGFSSAVKPERYWALAGPLVALAVILLVPLASRFPDGLQRVALDQGFAGREVVLQRAPLAHYAVPALDSSPLVSSIVAGMAGVILVCLVVYVLTYVYRRLRPATLAGDHAGRP